MDDIEAVRMARRALGNARNGIEAYEASIDLVVAERARHAERFANALRLMAAEVGTSRQGKKVAHALDRAGHPGPLLAWRNIQEAAEARDAAEEAVRDARRAILQIDTDLKTVGGWVAADEATLGRLREKGITALTPDNAEAAAAAARAVLDRSLSGMFRGAISKVGRQAMRYAMETGGEPAVLRPLHEIAVMPRKLGALRAKERDRDEAARALDAARARLAATPEPETGAFRAALIRIGGQATALRAIAMVADLDPHVEASLEHPEQIDRLEAALNGRVEALRDIEEWLVQAIAAPSIPSSVLDLLPKAASALESLADREPLRRDDLAPGRHIEASIRALRETERALPQGRDVAAAAPLRR